ncbi:MAG: hypothetical protein JHD16_00535 [Solirubrobacteraceae bacterium]|nr:hypothetical protein [Solirubrobacteraceae bacterium]
MPRLSATRLAGPLVVLLTLVIAAPAHADWTITTAIGPDSKKRAHIEGTAGDDHLTVSETGPGNFTFATTSGASINTDWAQGCTAGGPLTTTVHCTGITATPVAILANNGNDTVDATAIDTPLHVSAGAGDDTIYGGNGADTINADGGNDTLHGGPGNDTLHGGTITSPTSVVTLDGGPGDNTLYGSFNGGDIITGGHNQDTIHVASAAPRTTQVDGGPGSDTISYQAWSVAARARLSGPPSGRVSGPGGAHTILNVENIMGSDHDDDLRGDTAANHIDGRGGADTISGGNGGNDTLLGGPGNDTLIGRDQERPGTINGGYVQINGQDGQDHIVGIRASNDMAAIPGVPIPVAEVDGAHTASLDLNGGADNDTLIAMEVGPNTLAATGPAATLRGEAGNDTLVGQQVTRGQIIDAGTSTLIGGSGDDTLHGEIIDAGTILEPGAHVASYADRTDPVTATLGGTTGNGVANENDTIDSTVTGLIGGSAADTLTGTPAAETLDGRAGNDTIDGRGGADHVDGGDGDDRIIFRDGAASITGGPGLDTWDASWSSTGAYLNLRFADLENVIGTSGDDLITAAPRRRGHFDGRQGADIVSYSEHDERVRIDLPSGQAGEPGWTSTLTSIEHAAGGAGNDQLIGNDDSNWLTGNDGDDTLVGGGGDDILDGGAGNDTVSYESRTAPLTVRLDTTSGNGQAGEHDHLTRLENIVGGSGDDLLVGNEAANRLDGGAGNDTVSYEGRQAAVNVTLDGAANDGQIGEDDNVIAENVIGGDGDDLLVGDGNPNRLDGGPGNDTVDGAASNDTLNGGDGADTLIGGPGADLLDGGPGNDALRARDGAADTLRCGAGTDDAHIDTVDAHEACETVTAPEAPNSGNTPPGGGGSSGTPVAPSVTVVTGPAGDAPRQDDQPRPANNGERADRLASIRTIKDGVDYSLLRARRGQRVTVTGRLLNAAGQPIAGAQLGAYLRPTGQGEFEETAALRTDAQGRWTLRAVARLGGTLRVGYKANLGDVDFSRTKDIQLVVAPAITLKVNRTRVRNGQGVRFTAKVAGMPSWSKKIALLQVRVGGKWRTFGRDKHIGRTGIMRASYRFTGTVCLPGRRCVVPYKFRFYVPGETGWPFAGAASKAVTVRVRGSQR